MNVRLTIRGFFKVVSCTTVKRLEDFLFHQDNARPHKSNQTMAFLESHGFYLLPHPPYSPNLAPFDIHLFPELKNPLQVSKSGRIKSSLLLYRGL